MKKYTECHNCENKSDCERTYLGGCTDGEEKKLTDEEIVKALEYCGSNHKDNSCEICPLRHVENCYDTVLHDNTLDLIRRLQYDNSSAHKASEQWRAKFEAIKTELQKECQEHLAFAELAKKADEQQKAEIEFLTKIIGMSKRKTRIADLLKEIERLTEERNKYKGLYETMYRKWSDLQDKEFNCEALRKEKNEYFDKAVELQKQVDELKAKIPNNCVVLSKEEWNKLMGDTYTSKELDEIVAYKERVKAREVAQNILTKLAHDFDVAGMDVEHPLNRVKIYAKEYGVEVE